MLIHCKAQMFDLCCLQNILATDCEIQLFFLLDLGLNSKISVLLVFKDTLLALSYVVRSFKSSLMCFFIFFKELSTSS